MRLLFDSRSMAKPHQAVRGGFSGWGKPRDWQCAVFLCWPAPTSPAARGCRCAYVGTSPRPQKARRRHLKQAIGEACHRPRPRRPLAAGAGGGGGGIGTAATRRSGIPRAMGLWEQSQAPAPKPTLVPPLQPSLGTLIGPSHIVLIVI